jgi:hypothetical protein
MPIMKFAAAVLSGVCCLLLLLRAGVGGPLRTARPVRHEADTPVCQPVQCRPAATSTGRGTAWRALRSCCLGAADM